MHKILSLLLVGLLIISCGEKHFITDSEYLAKVEKKLKERQKFAESRSDELFGVLKTDISTEKKEALKFLFAYMPLCDLADYDGKFFLNQVEASFKAKEIFSWGEKIPEEVYRHFVLPYRINNENLDSARSVFLKELTPRIKNLSLKDAILEVNHWCHEKVSYRPTDIRTSAPLSTVRTSWGRCGEESTFTVTALRAVGIPARQVYTPRWAHCDDNHAWVEVWLNGNWHYLGACEPEADLDIAWFTEPAKRAMMVHTKVFGDYEADDDILVKDDNYTTISTLENYTKIKKVVVKVVDVDNQTIENADVDFGLYNYAEFYPIASKKTKSNGKTCLKTGLGDLLISANYKGNYGNKKISVGAVDTVTIVLNNLLNEPSSINYDINPPIILDSLKVNKTAAEQNNKRLKEEDKIRNKYMSSFISKEQSDLLSDSLKFDKASLWKIFDKSEGNWKNIKDVIFCSYKNKVEQKILFALLNNVNDKDLRDAEKNILLDHLINTVENNKYPDEIFNKYVLNPRIKNEMLTDYKSVFKKYFSKKITEENKAEKIKNYVLKNITIDNKQNYYDLPITPIGVHNLKISNCESRDIYFVAVCRSLGILARLEEAEKIPQYFDGKNWVNVNFEKGKKEKAETGFLTLSLENENTKIEPQYYNHFTIGKLDQGKFKTLDYEWSKKLSDFPEKIILEVGRYRIITGTRKENGSVLVNVKYFDIKKNAVTKEKLNIRKYFIPNKVYGKIDIKKIKFASLEEYKIFGVIDPDKEPTKHLLEDLKSLKKLFEKWNGKLEFYIPQNKITKSSEMISQNLLPENLSIIKNKNFELTNILYDKTKKETDYPFVFVANKKGEIIFISTGYKIGLGEQLLNIVL